MGKRFAEKFKEEYNFLEQYGFVFDVDPYNPERLCYRNDYGEIVLWIKFDGTIFFDKDFYIQINGWKKEIDVKSEYKRYIGKNCLFKTHAKMFKELFLFFLNLNGDFYGLKIYKHQFRIKSGISKDEIYNEKHNPTINKISNTILTTNIVIIFVLVFAQLGIVISYEYVTSYDTYLILRFILCVVMFVVTLMTIILLNKQLNFISKVYMLLLPIVLLYLIYYLPKRTDYVIYQSYFIIGLVYCIGLLVHKVITKNNVSILNAVIIMIYPFATLFLKSAELNDYLFGIDNLMGVFAIVSIVVSLVVVLLYLILRKDRSNKKEYIGVILAALFAPFILLFVTMQFTTQNINYSLDKSSSIERQYEVLEKDIRHSSGRYSHRRYYLTVIIDGKKENISTSAIVYDKYVVGDKIILSYQKGYLNDDYYEIDEDNLFK